MWRVKVSVPLAFRVRIRTLSLTTSLPFPSPFLPFPLDIASRVARTTTRKNDDGVVPRPHHLSGCRELVLSASRCSPRVVSRLALYPQSKYLSPLSCLANLLDSSVTQALRAMPAPPSRTGSQARCVFFFSLSIPADLQYTVHFCHVTTSASTARPTTTRRQPQLVGQRRGPPCATGRSGGERAATASPGDEDGTTRRPDDARDRVDVTSTTAPTGQRRDTHNDDDDDERDDGGGDTMRMDGDDGGGGGSWGV